MRRIGFLVNPIAGMGGRVGLKGTDGMVAEARERGAVPRASDRAARALAALHRSDSEPKLVAWGDPMGAAVARDAGFDPEVVGHPESAETSAEDTAAAVRSFLEADVDVILFAGGDGTAVDIARTFETSDRSVPILGIPAGVKVYSSVFAVDPEAAGDIVASYTETEGREVADIDEAAYREGEVQSEVYAVVDVPVASRVQSRKQIGGGSVSAAVAGFVASMDPDRTYLLGPGGTIGTIKDELGVEGTPLGVDIWHGGDLVATDVDADTLREWSQTPSTIVVSPIGGQGFIFGRGNQQFAPDIITACDVEIVASREKLQETGVLRVDTGDPDVDDMLRGWVRVRVGRVERRMMQIV